MNTIIIQGSARSNGNTYVIVKELQNLLTSDHIDLSKKNIHPYSYGHEHAQDDFLPLMRKIVDYELIIFATPVYWYSMSGITKNFLDRITDCLKIEKETGRKLRGKYMATISCGSEKGEVEGFFVPFRLSAEYLGMKYLGEIHTWIETDIPSKEVIDSLKLFAKKITGKLAHHSSSDLI